MQYQILAILFGTGNVTVNIGIKYQKNIFSNHKKLCNRQQQLKKNC